ncbi:hypothetical protein KY330_00745 [Candidatus Woesearchaeota archaeon]|nr:hypothetical protein [Candidatus Woesearchaeota archaeon]
MDKKAQEISLNVIIIAAIALIVLVVIVAVFTTEFGGFVKKLPKVDDAEVIRVQLLSNYDCKPSKTGIAEVKKNLENVATEEYDSRYTVAINDLVNSCGQNGKSACTRSCEWKGS